MFRLYISSFCTLLVLFIYRILNVAHWHIFTPQTFSYLPYPLISFSVCAPSFPISPLSFFVSFLLHQTLAPDRFSCEQGCSGGQGTSSPGFEAPSHPVDHPPPNHYRNTHTHKKTFVLIRFCIAKLHLNKKSG